MFSRERGFPSRKVLEICVWMGNMWTTLKWSVSRRCSVSRNSLGVFEAMCLGMVCVCSVAAPPSVAQVAPARESDSGLHLLTVAEGRSIVDVAWQQDAPDAGMRDCSHAVHQIYAAAGYEYPYASSFEIYAGHENFARVKYPHAGDLIVWPGHVGIVVDPLQHSFYSLVRTGLESQDYRSAYWRSRGRPRFYRYKAERGVVTAANAAGASRDLNGHARRTVDTTVEERATTENASASRPLTAASEKSAVIYGPPAPPGWSESKNGEAEFEIPASVIIAAGTKAPTREEVAQGFSELSDAVGSRLRTDNSLESQRPMVIVEQFHVERVDVKRDHGWASLVVDSKVLIGGGAAQVERRSEKVRWELRRTESGWEAITPTDRAYVPHDVAVKNLAANLARLANGDGAAKHEQSVLRQESQLASLLNALLASKDR
jgi:hypothetical protein